MQFMSKAKASRVWQVPNKIAANWMRCECKRIKWIVQLNNWAIDQLNNSTIGWTIKACAKSANVLKGKKEETQEAAKWVQSREEVPWVGYILSQTNITQENMNNNCLKYLSYSWLSLSSSTSQVFLIEFISFLAFTFFSYLV